MATSKTLRDAIEEAKKDPGTLKIKPDPVSYLDRRKNELTKQLEVEQAKTQLAQAEADRFEAEKRKREYASPMSNPDPQTDIGKEIVRNIFGMVQMNPQRAKEFLDSFTQDDINKVVALANSQDPRMTQWLSMARNPSMNVRDIIEIVRMINPQGPAYGYNQQPQVVVDIARVIEASKNNQPAQNQFDYMQFHEKVVQPIIAQVSQLKDQFVAVQMQQMQQQIQNLANRPTAAEELTEAKEKLEALGFNFRSGGGDGSANPETRKMELDFNKWKAEQDFDHLKWQMEEQWKQEQFRTAQGLERKKWDTIADKIIRPTLTRARPLIDAAVEHAQTRMSGMGSSNAPAPGAAQGPPTMTCVNPECRQRFPIPVPTPDTFPCPHCQHIYEKTR